MAITDRLMNNLVVHLPGALRTIIEYELWNVVNDLCRRGWMWRETLEITPVVGQTQYTPAPTMSEIVASISLMHTTMNVSDSVFEFGVLNLVRAPVAADAVTPMFYTVQLAPTLPSGADLENLIPSDLWSEHLETMIEGTLARMMVQAAKPYSNPMLATFHQRQYLTNRSLIRRKIETGGVAGGQTWRFPKFMV